MRSLSPENATLGIRDPTATLLLGYSQPKTEERALPPVFILSGDIKEHSNALRRSIGKVAHKAHNYRLHGCVGPTSDKDVHSRAQLFNDLEKLDQTNRPSQIAVWTKDNKLFGIEISYANGELKRCGACDGSPSQALALAPDGSEVIVEVAVEESFGENDASWISSLSVATSACNVLEVIEPELLNPGGETKAADKDAEPTDENAKTASATASQGDAVKPAESQPPATDLVPAKSVQTKKTTWLKPEDPRYSLRGWFGYQHNSQIVTLGCIWGKDNFVPIPNARIQPSLFKTFLGLSTDLQNNIRGHIGFAGNFLMGNSITTSPAFTSTGARPTAVGTKFFNGLDTIDTYWQIKSIGFASNSGKLCGLKVVYHNGKQYTYGTFNSETEKWSVETLADLLIVKMTAGRSKDDGPSFIDTVGFIRADSEGNLSDWPLEFSTLRYLGEGDERISKDTTKMIEQAPKIGNSQWSIRGFYGEYTSEQITRLGVIWGRG